MTVKVFKYGLLQPTENGNIVSDQIYLAHRYKNTLTEISREGRAAVRLAMRKHGDVDAIQTRIETLDTELKKARMLARAQNQKTRSKSVTSEQKQCIKNLTEKLRALRKELKAAKVACKEDPEVCAAIEVANETTNQKIRDARAVCNVYWGTYLQIEAAAKQARSGKMDPQFARWSGSGKVSVQLQGGLPVDDIFGSDTRIQIAPVSQEAWLSPVRGDRRRKSRTHLRFRVGSDKNKKPIWASWPMIMHRPLPEGGQIKWAHVTRRREGRHDRWELHIVVDYEPKIRHNGEGIIAVHFGWRVLEEGLRVSYSLDKSGKEDQMLLDPAISEGIKKTDDLRSIRDKQLDEFRPKLVEWIKSTTIPEWVVETCQFIDRWKSTKRFRSLHYKWREQRFAGDEEIFTLLDTWYRKDIHLMDWEVNQRRKSLVRRKEQYRIWAAHIARTYKTVIIDCYDLREIVRRIEKEESDDVYIATAAHNRFLASISECREVLEQACASHGATCLKIKTSPTTIICHNCDHKQEFMALERIKNIGYECENCDMYWDFDSNAVHNLMREHGGGAAPSIKEKQKVTRPHKEQQSDRSQMDRQPTEINAPL